MPLDGSMRLVMSILFAANREARLPVDGGVRIIMGREEDSVECPGKSGGR